MKNGEMENDPQAGLREAITPKLPQTKMKGNAGSRGKMGTNVSLSRPHEFADVVLQAAPVGLGLS
jgi:hypothetical protein